MIKLDEVTPEQSLILVFEECGFSLDEALEKLKEIEERNTGDTKGTYFIEVPKAYFDLLWIYREKEGITYSELARRLDISYETIRGFIKNTKGKLIAENAIKLKEFLRKERLIDEEGDVC